MFRTFADLRAASLIKLMHLAGLTPRPFFLVLCDDEDWVVVGNAGPFTCSN